MTNQPLIDKKAEEHYYKDEWMKNLKVTQELREELSKKEQAIQKTLQELKEGINDLSLDAEETGDFLRFIDTTFKKHFGGLAE